MEIRTNDGSAESIGRNPILDTGILTDSGISSQVRSHALWLYCKGFILEDVCDIFGFSEHSLCGWLAIGSEQAPHLRLVTCLQT